MNARNKQLLLLGVLYAALLTCPAPAQVRKAGGEVRCPLGVSFGVLNDRIIDMPAPEYPKEARRRGITGVVVVFVVVDEEGRVIQAGACAGPRELRRPAEDAAYKAWLRPTKLSGVAVKNRGALTYKFPPPEKGQ